MIKKKTFNLLLSEVPISSSVYALKSLKQFFFLRRSQIYNYGSSMELDYILCVLISTEFSSSLLNRNCSNITKDSCYNFEDMINLVKEIIVLLAEKEAR